MARPFSEVENRLRVGGRAEKEFPAPLFPGPAPSEQGLYKVAGARLLKQLGLTAGSGTGRAQPRWGRRHAARRVLGTPRGSLDARRPARRSLACGGRGKGEGLGKGGGGSARAVTCAAICVNYGSVESVQIERRRVGKRSSDGCFCYFQIFRRFELASSVLVLLKPGPRKPTDLSGVPNSLQVIPLNSLEPSNDSSLPVGFATTGFRNHPFSGLVGRGYIYRRIGAAFCQVLPISQPEPLLPYGKPLDVPSKSLLFSPDNSIHNTPCI